MGRSYSFEAVVWEHDGPAAWHFLSLPVECADEIADAVEGRTPAFGSVRVEATIGSTRWATSIFPDSARGTYVLPLKKAVRRRGAAVGRFGGPGPPARPRRLTRSRLGSPGRGCRGAVCAYRDRRRDR